MIWEKHIMLSRSLLFYWLFVTLFTMSLITGETYQESHILAGYLLVVIIIAKALFFLFKGWLNKTSAKSPTISPKTPMINAKDHTDHVLVLSLLSIFIFSLIFMALLSGLLSLAYDQRLGPMFSIIDYFPYWVFVTVSGVHEFVAYAAAFLIILFVNIKLFGHYWSINRAYHSN